jgi:hypothetical protein
MMSGVLKFSKGFMIVLFLCIIPAMALFAPSLSYGDDCDIHVDISPNVLNIGSLGKVVTVHVDIAFDDVDPGSVSLCCSDDRLDCVLINRWKSDSLGNFVAKFLMDDVEEDVTADQPNTLTLIGKTKDGAQFCGQQDINVIDTIGQREKNCQENCEETRERTRTRTNRENDIPANPQPIQNSR